ncbi:MAG: hypothetical protein QGH43_13250, partial [Arenicellales bacterium]|nr:hypothetical protein [Arenicellales bacterium]
CSAVVTCTPGWFLDSLAVREESTISCSDGQCAVLLALHNSDEHSLYSLTLGQVRANRLTAH